MIFIEHFAPHLIEIIFRGPGKVLDEVLGHRSPVEALAHYYELKA